MTEARHTNLPGITRRLAEQKRERSSRKSTNERGANRRVATIITAAVPLRSEGEGDASASILDRTAAVLRTCTSCPQDRNPRGANARTSGIRATAVLFETAACAGCRAGSEARRSRQIADAPGARGEGGDDALASAATERARATVETGESQHLFIGGGESGDHGGCSQFRTGVESAKYKYVVCV